MEAQETTWEGSVQATIPVATADQAWSLLKDFSAFHRLLPTIHTCVLTDGVNGVPGCTRRCTAPTPDPSEDGGEPPAALWVTEKLLSVDAAGRSYSYEVTDGNMGFRRYVATIGVKPADGDRCRLEWSFAADPVEGWSRDALVGYLQSGLSEMAKRIQGAVEGGGFPKEDAKSGAEETAVDPSG